MAFWSVVCAVLGLGFAAEAMGLFAHELNSALAVLLFVTSAVLVPWPKTEPGTTNRWRLAAGVVAALVGLGLSPAGWSVRFFGIALWFWGLHTAAKARGGRVGYLMPLGIGCVVFGVFEWCSGTSLLAWYTVQNLSRALSEAVGRLCGEAQSLGPTFNGVGMLVLALGIGIGGLLASPLTRRAFLRFVVTIVAAVVLYLGYLCIFAVIPLGLPSTEAQAELPLWRNPIETIVTAVYPLHVPLLLPLLFSVLLGWYLRALPRPIQEPESRRTAWVPIAIVAVSSVLAAWSLTNLPAPQRVTTRRVAIYEHGFLNWLVPTHEKYGRYSPGMFGNMPKLVRCMGWEAEIIPEITATTLAEKDILVMINQEEALPGESIKTIERWVNAGGGLLVMGDHTFWKDEPRLVLNEPIEHTNIRVVFDSADFFIGGWLHSYRMWPHPITASLDDHTNEPGSVVGASLEVRYPATPILIGRHGYSDPGVPERTDRGYLGNLDYDPGEMLGDIVLAACQNVGRGRVVVVGDTSSFTNAIQNRTWPYVHRVFYWLGNDGRATIPRWRDSLGVVLALFVVVCLLFTVRSTTIVLPVAGVVLFCAVWLSHQMVQRIGTPPPLKGNVAVVDFSRVGQFSLEGWHKDGIDGVFLNLMRDGYFSIACKKFDAAQISASTLFVTVAPSAPYSTAELRVLKEYMRNGGTVVLAVGWEERAPVEPLLDMVGLRIAARALGRVSGAGAPLEQQPMLYEAWPVLGGDETLLEASGEPVVVRKSVGKGQIVVIGDTQFLRNKNVEVKEGAILQNVRFFSWMLKHAMNR